MSNKLRSVKSAAKTRRGQGLVEYIIIVAAVAMISLVSVSVFGHKVADQYAIGAGILPGAHGDDNVAIAGAQFAETDATSGTNTGTGVVSWAGVIGSVEAGELQNNISAANLAPGTAVDGAIFVAE